METLVEQYVGVGDLTRDHRLIRRVRYDISVHQGVMPGSGLPIPGLRTLDGAIDYDASRDPGDLIGASLTLQLEDGRHVGITLTDGQGHVKEARRGSIGCSCC